MGKTPGRKGDRRLADMRVAHEPEEYCLPPPGDCEDYLIPPIMLPEQGHRIHGRFVVWTERDKVVEFAIIHSARVDGEWRHVAKIDTSRGVVHRHVYDRATGVDLLDHQPLEVIPAEGWDVVDRWYTRALEMLDNQWQENVRRWSGD